MRNMSFRYTERRLLAGRKTVTRRKGWSFVLPGDRIRAIRQGQGLKKGQHIVPLGVLTVKAARREFLNQIDQADCDKEGYPELYPKGFVEMFCSMNHCGPATEVTRIEFEFEPAEGALCSELSY